jgi:signal transduction histidine kinase
MNLASSRWSRARPLLRQFLIDFALITGINIIIAVVVTYLMHIGRSFLENLVISMCIGWLAQTFIDGTRLLIWGNVRPPKLPFLCVWLVGVPLALRLGNHIAGRLLGIPIESINAVRAQNSTAFMVLTILVCVFISFLFHSRMKVERLKAEAESEKARASAIEKQAMQAQLQLLQAQIEPHMLFNTLANLQGLIAVDPARAHHMLDQFILYLRATLSSSRAEKTTLAHEFSLLDAYLGLMSVRMGKRLSYTLELPEALRELHIPPMLLQPLVENAIKHGLEPKIEGGRIDVHARLEDGRLRLSVADTGLGLEQAAHTKHHHAGTHVGLDNVRERLQALYGEQASFSLTPNTPSGVIAFLTIPS